LQKLKHLLLSTIKGYFWFCLKHKATQLARHKMDDTNFTAQYRPQSVTQLHDRLNGLVIK